jgi:hypothetical protein
MAVLLRKVVINIVNTWATASIGCKPAELAAFVERQA